MLAAWGAVMGLIFGAIMNIWFWPFMQGDAGQTAGWHIPGRDERVAGGAQLRCVLRGNVRVVGRCPLIGNALLILLFGGPILRVLRRFKKIRVRNRRVMASCQLSSVNHSSASA